MAKEIKNSFRSSSIIHVIGAGTETVTLADLAKDNTETVNSAQIKRVMWSSNGSVTVLRDATKVAELYGSGDMRFSDYGYAIDLGSTSNVVVTIVSGGTAILEVTKDSVFNPSLDNL